MERNQDTDQACFGPRSFFDALVAGACRDDLLELLVDWAAEQAPTLGVLFGGYCVAGGELQCLTSRRLSPLDIVALLENLPPSPHWTPQTLPEPAGLADWRACWFRALESPPGCRVGAVLLLSREPGEPSPEQQRLLETLAFCVGITQGREVRDHAVQVGEQQFSSLFHQAAVGMLQLERDGTVSLVNARLAALLGRGREEIEGRRLNEVLDPVAERAHCEAIQGLLEGARRHVVIEYRHRRPDHETVWLRACVSAVTDADGTVLRAVGVVEELTSRRRDEQRQRFLARFNNALRGCNDPQQVMATAARLVGEHLAISRAGYVELDLDRGYASALAEHCNDALSMVGRWRLEEVMPSAILSELERGQTVAIRDARNDPRTVDRREYSERTQARAGLVIPLVKGGSLVAAFVVHHHRPRDWERHEIALVEEVAEQTWLAVENERTREALRASEQKYKSLVDNAPEAIMVLDVDTWHIVEANDRGLRMFGMSRTDLNRADWRDMLPPSQPDGSPSYDQIQRLNERALGGEVVVAEAVRRTREGEELFVELRLTALPDPAGRRLVRGTITDITQRKRAEQALAALNETLEQRVAERTAEAERRASQLRALAAQLADVEQRERRRIAEILHDHLQQLLVAGKLRVNFLQNRVQDPVLEPVLAELRDLLDQSVDASRSLTVELSPPILYDAGLVPALEWLARWAKEKNHLEVGLSAESTVEPLPEDVRAFLFQAVRELLFNVVKHGGVREAQVSLARSLDNRLLVTVSDTGSGFDADQAMITPTDGSFGLFSIRERVEMLGGSFRVDSAPGKGTRVRLSVPVEHAVAEAPTVPEGNTEQAQLPMPLGRTRVLLVDDHRILREGLAELLREEPGIELVGEACDGQMAVELADELHPDVVIMDVSMPRLNGVEATRRITSKHPGIHVIGLSMHDQEDMAAAMLEAGAEQFLTKGGPVEELIAAIRHVTC